MTPEDAAALPVCETCGQRYDEAPYLCRPLIPNGFAIYNPVDDRDEADMNAGVTGAELAKRPR